MFLREKLTVFLYEHASKPKLKSLKDPSIAKSILFQVLKKESLVIIVAV